MHGISKFSVALLAMLNFVFCFSALAFSQEKRLSLDFQQGRVSADISKMRLGAVVEAVEKETGIHFETGLAKNHSMLNEEITLRFSNLSMQDALERILSRVNHAIMLDADGKSIASVVLLGEPSKRQYRKRSSRRRRRSTRRR
jgi:hypothetical protein